MESLTACSVSGRFALCFPSTSFKSRFFSHRRPSRFKALASRDGPELDKWDQMELKFGKLLGEDPNLTLAKIMARKVNPDVSFLEVEKSFYKNKGKLDASMLSIGVDLNVERTPSDSTSIRDTNLNLSRPVMKKGDKTTAELNLSRPVINIGTKTASEFNLTRPVMNNGVKTTPEVTLSRPVSADLKLSRPVMNEGFKTGSEFNLIRPVMGNGGKITPEVTLSRPVMNNEGKAVRPVEQNQLPWDIENPPNVTLRKPNVVQEDDVPNKPSKLRIKPNLFLKMRKDNDVDPCDVSLLKKPEVLQKLLDPQENVMKALGNVVKPLSPNEMLQEKPLMTSGTEPSYSISDSAAKSNKLDEVDIGLQPPKQRGVESEEVEALSSPFDDESVHDSNDISHEASLLGKPQRLDSSAKDVLLLTGDGNAHLKEISHSSESVDADMGIPVSAEQEERESIDWKSAKDLFHTGERADVELVSCSGRGFVVSFGSLVGFLPYRNLGTKWKFLAFESWLREKGLDPSLYRQNLSIIGSYDVPTKNLAMESDKDQKMAERNDEILTSDMKFEDLLKAYDEEKTKFLSSFVGQRLKVSVLLADKNSKRLMFSGKPKEKEELVEKKRILMAKLGVGDVVKCCIKKITYFGIFVEVEGVSALVHQSEVSWDATLDPSSYYKIGQIVEAKVHQLDYALERIFLSLKEIMPDPLKEALESVIGGDRTSLAGNLEAAQADIEPWADVESLIEELHQIDGVQSVSKGRFFLSPGLAPTFQVYMASVFENQYKLLARYENKVQEVIVQASLDKEQMKDAILTSTNRVK